MLILKYLDRIKTRLLPLLKSLRAHVALGVAFPIFLALSSLSILNYWRGHKLIEEQARMGAIQIGNILNNSLTHAMLVKDGGHLLSTIEDVGSMESVINIQMIGLSGLVLTDNDWEKGEEYIDFDSDECQECHQFPPEKRPRVIELEGMSDILRVSTPIDNQPICYECHQPDISHLGVLLIDMSIADLREKLVSDLQINMLFSTFGTIVLTIGAYYLVNNLVVKRIEAFRKPLVDYAVGNFSTRIEKSTHIDDEISDLADTFHHMADELDRLTREKEHRSRLRERAIINERQRIARELHDGLSQVLGYVNTKVMTVRLLLMKEKFTEADQQLIQIEEAARGLSVDVREAIHGLKMADQSDVSLETRLKDYITKFNRLSGIPVKTYISPKVKTVELDKDYELQLLRIVQEGLTNTRKHASASQIWVNLLCENNSLVLLIKDDGCGFDPETVLSDHYGQFGLSTMLDRATEIGASMTLESKPGFGTNISVKLPINGR